jgi:hypothetical protein
MKPMSTEAGTITLSDGSKRNAWKNTYESMKFSADGSTAEKVTETRIEFEIDANANQGGRKYRKVSAKQASTFITD